MPQERLHLGCRLHLLSTGLRVAGARDLGLTSEALPHGFGAQGSPLCPPSQPGGTHAPLSFSGTTAVLTRAATPGCLQGQRGTASPSPGSCGAAPASGPRASCARWSQGGPTLSVHEARPSLPSPVRGLTCGVRSQETGEAQNVVQEVIAGGTLLNVADQILS